MMEHIRSNQPISEAVCRLSGQKMRNFSGFIVFLKKKKKRFYKSNPATTNNNIKGIHSRHLRLGHLRHCSEDIEDIS